MKIIKPEGLKEIQGGAVYDCVCSHGSVNAKVDGFWKSDCGHQCSYGPTNSNANYQKAHKRPRPGGEPGQPGQPGS